MALSPWHHLSPEISSATALGLPTSGDDCRPVVTVFLPGAFAGAGIGVVETDPAVGWANRLALIAAEGWSGKA